MADEEQFSLCWNNFNTNLSAGFHESLCRGDLVDVTLAAEGQLVKAHRLVLSVCSPYFRKMFTQMPANQHAFGKFDCNSQIENFLTFIYLTVFLKEVSASVLKDLIQFMYCGEVNVKQETLPAFISTAEALQIKGLTESVSKTWNKKSKTETDRDFFKNRMMEQLPLPDHRHLPKRSSHQRHIPTQHQPEPALHESSLNARKPSKSNRRKAATRSKQWH